MPTQENYPTDKYNSKTYAALVSYLNAPRWVNVEMMFTHKKDIPSPPEFVIEDPEEKKPE
jgi:hypothetical protein